eukprot:TRINITY_DN12489_c3_g1_i1.p1 TRINITY_DN12489_c3_g1~~TRINITY_DN12489_c3_g1_i1.p1  ORF type:complete len:673 (+),score=60.30 TRINITY_DN12489_c3_g1_i1:55-2073(+)
MLRVCILYTSLISAGVFSKHIHFKPPSENASLQLLTSWQGAPVIHMDRQISIVNQDRATWTAIINTDPNVVQLYGRTSRSDTQPLFIARLKQFDDYMKTRQFTITSVNTSGPPYTLNADLPFPPAPRLICGSNDAGLSVCASTESSNFVTLYCGHSSDQRVSADTLVYQVNGSSATAEKVSVSPSDFALVRLKVEHRLLILLLKNDRQWTVYNVLEEEHWHDSLLADNYEWLNATTYLVANQNRSLISLRHVGTTYSTRLISNPDPGLQRFSIVPTAGILLYNESACFSLYRVANLNMELQYANPTVCYSNYTHVQSTLVDSKYAYVHYEDRNATKGIVKVELLEMENRLSTTSTSPASLLTTSPSFQPTSYTPSTISLGPKRSSTPLLLLTLLAVGAAIVLTVACWYRKRRLQHAKLLSLVYGDSESLLEDDDIAGDKYGSVHMKSFEQGFLSDKQTSVKPSTFTSMWTEAKESIAAEAESTTLAVQLNNLGPYVDYLDDQDQSLLTYAVICGHIRAIELLMDRSSDNVICARDRLGYAPIHWTVLTGNVQALETVVQHDARWVNLLVMETSRRQTLLHLAVLENHHHMFETLFRLGLQRLSTRLFAKDWYNCETPMDIAHRLQHKECIDALQLQLEVMLLTSRGIDDLKRRLHARWRQQVLRCSLPLVMG